MWLFLFSLNVLSIFWFVPGILCSLFIHLLCRALCGYFQSGDSYRVLYFLLSPWQFPLFHFLFLELLLVDVRLCEMILWISYLYSIFVVVVALLKDTFSHLFVNPFTEHLNNNFLTNNIHLGQKSKITKEIVGRSKPPSGPHSSDIQFTKLVGRFGTAETGAESTNFMKVCMRSDGSSSSLLTQFLEGSPPDIYHLM